MSIEVDLNDVNEALLDQVRDLSGRLARSTAAIRAQQQHIEAMEQIVANLTGPSSPLQPPAPSG